MKAELAVLTVIVVLSGCQPANAPASGAGIVPLASAGTAAPPTASPSPTDVALASGPLMTLRIVGDVPIIRASDGPPGHIAVLPAATAVDGDGSIVAFLVWFGTARDDHVVTVARSTDGRRWAIDPTPIYTDLGLGLAHPGPIPGAAVRTATGDWLLYGWGATPRDSRSFASWRATAARPAGPWATTSNPWVLPVGPTGAWDDQTAAASAVLAVGEGFAMWYEGQRAGSSIRGGIGYAASSDGISWTRWAGPAGAALGAPVLGPGACGPGTSAATIEPQVWRRGDGYLMVFTGSDGSEGRPSVYGATSLDRIHWSCTGQVLLRAKDVPGSQGIHSIQGVTVAGEPGLLVESLGQGGTSEIWLALLTVGP